jgi:hypothetical protein
LGSFSSLGALGVLAVRAEKNLKSADFRSCARCAPERTKAQRAAPFGNLGAIGFVLND